MLECTFEIALVLSPWHQGGRYMYVCTCVIYTHTHACNVCCNHPGRNVYTCTYIVCICIMSLLWAAVVSRTWKESKQLSQSKTRTSTPSYNLHSVNNSLPISKQNTHKPNTCTVHNSSIGLSIELHNTQCPPISSGQQYVHVVSGKAGTSTHREAA